MVLKMERSSLSKSSKTGEEKQGAVRRRYRILGIEKVLQIKRRIIIIIIIIIIINIIIINIIIYYA